MTSFNHWIHRITRFYGSYLKNLIQRVKVGNSNRFSRIKRKTVGDAYPLPNITEILDQEVRNILAYST